MDPQTSQKTIENEQVLGLFNPKFHEISYELGEQALDLLNGISPEQAPESELQ